MRQPLVTALAPLLPVRHAGRKKRGELTLRRQQIAVAQAHLREGRAIAQEPGARDEAVLARGQRQHVRLHKPVREIAALRSAPHALPVQKQLIPLIRRDMDGDRRRLRQREPTTEENHARLRAALHAVRNPLRRQLPIRRIRERLHFQPHALHRHHTPPPLPHSASMPCKFTGPSLPSW